MRDCRNLLKYHHEKDGRLKEAREIIKEFRICTQYAMDAWATKNDWLKTPIQKAKQLFMAPETLHATHCTVEAFIGENTPKGDVHKKRMVEAHVPSLLTRVCAPGYVAQLCILLPAFMRDTGTRWPTTVRTAVGLSRKRASFREKSTWQSPFPCILGRTLWSSCSLGCEPHPNTVHLPAWMLLGPSSSMSPDPSQSSHSLRQQLEGTQVD